MIKIVEKSENAPNVTQARPIEEYWSLCRRKYKKRVKPAKSLHSLRQIWRNISEMMSKENGQNLMVKARRNLRLIGRHGVLEPLKQRN
jgi:hypothetical protein